MTSLLERPRAAAVPPVPSAPNQRRRSGRLGSWVREHRRSLAWLTPVLAISAVVQAINLGGSPQRIDDEGTYTAQAWAVLNLGELAHYTYWYDHPPVGWLQIAAWTGLTGGFDRYDIAVVAAREAMVVATLVSVVLLWFIARRVGLSRPAAAIAGALFALSPLAVQFHRTVYLDNVATPWLLAAILLAMTRTHQLAGFAGAALSLGVAVLSKETYLLALPLVAWLMWRNARPETRRYTLSVAGSVLVLIGGSYLMLAIVKGELTPGDDRVSLFDGIAFQLAARESSGSPLTPGTLANDTLSVWFQLDPVLLLAAPIAGIAGLFVRRLRPFAIMLAFLIAFVFRPGGYLPVPYVIMLLPLAALLLAGVTDAAVRAVRARRGARRVPPALWIAATIAGVAVFVPTGVVQQRGLLLADLDMASREAQSWIADNVSRESRLLVDDAMWVDLVEAGFPRDNVIWFYKLDTDPAVQDQSPNGWRDSDFVVTTDSMLTSPNAASAQTAIDNSTVVASFGEGNTQVEVRRIHSDGIEQSRADAGEELEFRTDAGLEVSANSGLTASEQNLDRLGAGQVDERISLALGQLLVAGEVVVGDLPIVPGEEDLVFRQVVIESIDGEPLTAAGRITDAGREVERILEGRYAAQAVEVADGGLLLTFSIVQPEGLIL